MRWHKFDRDLILLAVATVFFAIGYGLYSQLLFVYALRLGASRFTIGVLNAVVFAVTAVGYIPGAWAASRFRLKTVISAVWWLTVPTALLFAAAPSWPWLVPGLVLSGCYMANNPASKAYIFLKSEPTHVARNMMFVYGAYPLGLIGAPSLGGLLADHIGMRRVFLVSAALFVLSSIFATLIHDTPYHVTDEAWSLRALRHNRLFRRYVVFFVGGFLAIYLAQPFIAPFLAQVHHQGYGAIGIYMSLAAAGATVLSQVIGRAVDLRGPRTGVVAALGILLVGVVLLIAGTSAPLWGSAMICLGGIDAFRYIANGIVGQSFGRVPLVWGFAVFDAAMGIPTAGGALLGGALYSQGFRWPFIAAIGVVAVLLLGLALPPRGREAARQPAHAGAPPD